MTRPAPAGPADHPERWYAQPAFTGRLLTLAPLTIEHAPALHTALWAGDGGTEVYRWLGAPPPETVEQMTGIVYAALAHRAAGRRLPYAQLDSGSGSVIGTTSFYEVDPALRTVAIGHTWLGRPWWRTGHNTESKLLMLGYAFDQLGAARVVWHTDVRNERSRAAIERLGARFEGELRKHRILADGTWRTTAQFSMVDDDWPACRARLRAALDR
ncbi:MAG TPA: GNAT family protein [Jatrophihabitans sp.]|nr:GNAT family protein [Jatrophihabitans sp.]